MTKMAAANMYRVGDYVYFEANSGAPYQIRRIEELNKTSTGNVEAKVMCFYRRRDISSWLLKAFNRCTTVVIENLAGKKEKTDGDEKPPANNGDKQTPLIAGQERLSNDQRHWLTHRELFLSRQIEVLPATHIRGKCSVALLNEVETPEDYLGREDAFFYSLIYDPELKSLVADKGEIRVGENYQAEIPPLMPQQVASSAVECDTTDSDCGTAAAVVADLMYDSNQEIDQVLLEQYLVIARAVGTFARALDMNTMVKIPSLHMCAASAVRDVTTQQAMNMLHNAGYDFGKAVLSFVPPASRELTTTNGDKVNNSSTAIGGPLMARDQLEEWSAAEANLFEEALEKYGKDFNDIRNDFLHWKSLKNIVEYYYMYKTTDRYVQQKRAKAAEAESRLKQVYIPTYTKPNPNIISAADSEGPSYSCESCKTTSSEQWYAWGPTSPPMRVCSGCWTYWKRYGGLKTAHKYENYDRTTGATSDQASVGSHGSAKYNGRSGNEPMRLHIRRDQGTCTNGVATGSGRSASAAARSTNQPKTRSSIYLQTSLWTKVARRLAPKHVYNARHHARHPCEPISSAAISQHCQSRSWKDIQNVVKLICRNPTVDLRTTVSVSNNQTAAAAATANLGGRRKRGAQSPSRPVKHVRVSESQIADFVTWQTGLDGCMFVTSALRKMRQKLTSAQLHRLSRNPCKQTKVVAALVGDGQSATVVEG